MPSVPAIAISRLLAVLTAVLILKVTAAVVFEYRHYMPPDFQADFLVGREPYFWGGYHWAFYVHLASGPTSLVLGTVLVSERFRQSFPSWHRRLGRVQVACVLLFLTPSGLWMAFYAATGAVAGAGLGALAIATAICVALGWRYAVLRQFACHRRWMMRTFILLCSAVVIRLIGGLTTVAEIDAVWIYPASAWVSWLAPLAMYEICQRVLSTRSDVTRTAMTINAR